MLCAANRRAVSFYMLPIVRHCLTLENALAEALAADGRAACSGLPAAMGGKWSGRRFPTIIFRKCDGRIIVGPLTDYKKRPAEADLCRNQAQSKRRVPIYRCVGPRCTTGGLRIAPQGGEKASAATACARRALFLVRVERRIGDARVVNRLEVVDQYVFRVGNVAEGDGASEEGAVGHLRVDDAIDQLCQPLLRVFF